MTDVTKMALKILYSLDNGTTATYLARSKKQQCVRIATIPNPDSTLENDVGSFKIGAVELSFVLQEIYLNSPELLNHNISRSGHDYNLYYQDICELDEPLVSLGLLSEIRQKMGKLSTQESYPYEDGEEEEPFIVTGRICSSFAALLKPSYKATGNNTQRKHNTPSNDTLEVKLRFIRVVTNKNARRPSASISNVPMIPVPTAVVNQMHFKSSNGTNPTQKMGRPARIITGSKRQTNPTPAPKAERTQSLPIWNPKQGSNHTGLPTNSIAHKIFLADRNTENLQAKSSHQQATTYQVSALQQDNTVQKFRVDDSVSKRFDFMLNKKKKNQNQPQQQRQQLESTKSSFLNTNKKYTTAAKARRCNTMAAIPLALGNSLPNLKTESKQQRSGSISSGVYKSIQEQESVFQQILSNSPTKQHNTPASAEDDKENLPPSIVPKDNIDLDLLNFSDVGLKSDLDWFGNYDPFNSPSIIPEVPLEHALKPSSATPKDPNTCNTVDIENDGEDEEGDKTPRINDNNDKVDALNDADRTSPIDTLSMPLMELNDRPSCRMVSCQEQLQRLPLLGNQLKSTSFISRREVFKDELRGPSEEEIDNDEDATSVLMQFSSSYPDNSPSLKKSDSQRKITTSEYSSPLLKRHRDCDIQEACEDEEEQKDNFKKQRIMPSSPTMFNYPDDSSNHEDANDLFSSFMHGPQNENQDVDSTPDTRYENQSSDHIKNI